ncbi:hypothetical protein [Actinacidiphila acididurans]|uniref:Uncharacterized protein n=1 Tax=Actinacidiphila acididurans TaxID=2784346 RepID=A0ABS2TX20_9ACTN|nr:hypothetical protein [Actinacidiphila acididurans]MBM9507888.1 hypothetical protein [Actinacidiphila acididurans]
MKIDPDDKRVSLPRRWGLPLGVAAGVAAVSVAAVAVFGGEGTAKPVLAAGGGTPTSTATSPSPSPSPSPTRVSPSAAGGSTPASSHVAPTSTAFTVTSTATTPIAAGTVAKILASCLGSDAPNYHAVIAVRTPVASQDWDGAVVAVGPADQYVQCETKSDRGTSQAVPPTFINNRLWGTGHTIEYFDSTGEPAGAGRYLSLGAGHYTSDVAKITISYGDNPKQYPATMSGGAFFYTAAFTTGTSTTNPFSAMAPPYVHAYNATGKEIYNQQKDPQFTGDPK